MVPKCLFSEPIYPDPTGFILLVILSWCSLVKEPFDWMDNEVGTLKPSLGTPLTVSNLQTQKYSCNNFFITNQVGTITTLLQKKKA